MLENVNNIYKKIYNLQHGAQNLGDFKPEVVKEFEKMYQEMTAKNTGSSQNKTAKAVHPFLEKTEEVGISTAAKYRIDAVNDAETKKLINEAIMKAANKYKISDDLINAIIKVESNYDPYAVSRAGAMGLMQLMPKTMLELGVAKPFDIEENVDGGTNYIKQMLTRYDGDLEKSLAAYNAGPNAVDDTDGIPDIPETLNYVSTIKKLLFK